MPALLSWNLHYRGGRETINKISILQSEIEGDKGDTEGKGFSVLGVELTILNILAREAHLAGCGRMSRRQI